MDQHAEGLLEMKPFKIDRNSWHYKLNKHFLNADSMYYTWEPKHNNFCSYWRATMFRLFFLVLFVCGFTIFSCILGIAAWSNPFNAFIVLVSLIGAFAIIFALVVISVYLDERKYKNRDVPDVPKSLIVQKYIAYKSKVCPMVEYEK